MHSTLFESVWKDSLGYVFLSKTQEKAEDNSYDSESWYFKETCKNLCNKDLIAN